MAMKRSAFPCGQTPSTKPATSIMSTTSSAKTAPSGRSFPSRISAEVAGVTWSWSKVPVRRSFTIETAVMIVVRKESTKPKVPATMKGLPSRRGLKSARDGLDPAGRRRGGGGDGGGDAGGEAGGEAGAAACEEASDERLGVAGERRLAPVVDHLHLRWLPAVQIAV